MDKLTGIRIKQNDGTYSNEIPVSALAENIVWDTTHTLSDVLGNVDLSEGSLQSQINTTKNNVALKANIASPTFTGTPAAPTVGSSDSSTKIATTEFVHSITDDLAEDISDIQQSLNGVDTLLGSGVIS